jgi:WD40 repeat protein
VFLALAAEDRLVASGSAPAIGLWDLETGEQVGAMPGAGAGFVSSDPAGESLFAGHGRALARYPLLYDRDSGLVKIRQPVATPLALPYTYDADMSSDGQVWLSTHRHGGAWLWHPRSDRPPIRLPIRDGWHGAVSPDGKWVATIGDAQVWDARTAQPVATLPEEAGATRNASLQSIQFSADGRWLAVFGDPGTLFAVGTWKRRRALGKGGIGVISADGTWLARADDSGAIHLETLEDGEELGVLAPPQPQSYSRLRLTRDGSRLPCRARRRRRRLGPAPDRRAPAAARPAAGLAPHRPFRPARQAAASHDRPP